MSEGVSTSPRRVPRAAVVLLAVAGTAAVAGVVVIGGFHREYGDITRPGYAQAAGPASVLAVLVAVPASFAVALAGVGRRWLFGLVAAVIVLGAPAAALVTTEHGVRAKERAMPTAPSCSGGDPAEETEPLKAAGVAGFEAALAPYRQVFAELPSPGRFGAGVESVDGCGGWLVGVGVAEAYVFYLRELPSHGWAVVERAPGEMLVATRRDLTFEVGMAVTDGEPFVEVYRTGSPGRLNAGPG